jgi:hypothetical protein
LHQDLVRLVCSGGATGAELAPGVHALAPSIGAAAEELDQLIDSTDS